MYEAQLQGANLFGAQLQGTDLGKSRIWLADFPGELSDQSPRPLGGVELYSFPLTKPTRALLRDELKADITDSELLNKVMIRVDPILRDAEWRDEESWSLFRSETKDPPIGDLVGFLAGMACEEHHGYIAKIMAHRAMGYSKIIDKRPYAKSLAEALLDETCGGAKKLTDEMRTKLEEIVAWSPKPSSRIAPLDN